MKVKIGDLTKIRTGKLDANASSEDGQYPFFTCSRETLKISTYSYDCECVLVAGNGAVSYTHLDVYKRQSEDLRKVCKTKKTELLFLALFLRILKIGGRCACIVPDGVLFGSSTAHKAIRKEIIENQKLEAVISMPSGVFKPYAGVSTAVLVFTKTDNGGTDDVWFYDMMADGFSLDDKRSPVSDNDIPDIIGRFQNLEKEKDRKRTEKSFMVPKEEIINNAYDLSINKYKEVEYVDVYKRQPQCEPDTCM